MNGSLTDTKSMVITENDYNRYLVEQQVLFEQLKRELILNSFIFIGYSFSDNLVLNCLSEIKRSLPHLNNFHYRVAVKDTEHPEFEKIEKRYFENSYNIKTIYVDDFNEIDDFLNHLHQLYKEKNIFISDIFLLKKKIMLISFARRLLRNYLIMVIIFIVEMVRD